MMVRRKKRQAFILVSIAIIAVATILFYTLPDSNYILGFFGIEPKDSSLVLTTGYCNCGECCGWERTNDGTGEAVYNYGPQKGKIKKIGITASGTRASHGTIAADLSKYPMGTRLFIPGYGEGKVEDIGGAIKGRHIDLWFPTHDAARRWGRRWLKVEKIKRFKK